MPGNDFRRYYKRRNFSPVRSNDFSRFFSLFCGDRLLALAESMVTL